MTMWQIIIGLTVGVVAAFVMAYGNQRAIRDRHFEENPHTANPGDTCSICLETMLNNTMSYFPCGHATHEECRRTLIRNGTARCPLCRKRIA